MERKAAAQGQQIGQGVGNMADTLSPGADATSAGNAIKQGIVGPGGFRDRTSGVASQLYNNLDAHIPPTTPVALPHTAQAFNTANPVIPGAPNLTPLFQNGKINAIRAMFAKDAGANPSLPYQGVKQLRTSVGKEIANNNFASDVPAGDWRGIYGGLSQDMQGAAHAQGPQASQAFNRANGYYRAVQNRSDAIAHVVNQDAPEAVFNAAMRNTKDGATTLHAVMQSLPDGAQREVGSAVLRRMGRAINS